MADDPPLRLREDIGVTASPLVIEVRRYRFPSAQLAGDFSAFAGDSIIRSGADVGLFRVEGDDLAVVALGAQPFDESLATDDRFPCEAIDTSLVRTFDWLPQIERRFSDAARRYQLRIYEHPHVAAGVTKAEMFETEEVAIFRRVGLHPVFFGKAVAGPELPNLTYLLGFEDADARRSAWKTFIADPAWKRLSAISRFSDELLFRRITNLDLAPLPGSTF